MASASASVTISQSLAVDESGPSMSGYQNNMKKQCIICEEVGKYRCPKCLVFYCSTSCFKEHKKNCVIATKDPKESRENAGIANIKYPTADTVFPAELEKLKDDKEISDLLCNAHLRNYLVEINNSSNAEDAMQKAMQEPIFVEFALACLRVVKPMDPGSD